MIDIRVGKHTDVYKRNMDGILSLKEQEELGDRPFLKSLIKSMDQDAIKQAVLNVMRKDVK